MKTTAVLTATVLALTGCTGGTATQWRDFNTREAGSEIDSGYFGNATMNNNQVQTDGSAMMLNLNRRFSSEVNTSVNFAFNSTVLDAAARSTLQQQASWIRQFPEIRFKVYGHTDLVGSTSYNRRLGLRRAEAAVLYLTSQGISRDRLEAVVSFGETQPLVVTQGEERRNRRTVTEVSGWVAANNATPLDGRYAEVIFREYVESATAPQRLSGEGIESLGE
ncbi:OmpA family protein [Octadecabacter sp. 1_MG-2023]|uniref:OmpA family protein n=1 Tax=unclassified Octadecabacter TaxID=196158 RepID=UPI001C094A02|nr:MULTISPECIES: OmpA family protein [unclassified Octadecabacter]MBU2991999.1 OmpA family protein [Octadecabacter sp. B2R22]MDO6735973.1 OmpA family protein [Octadecabacter sp. 1_MG-2023]